MMRWITGASLEFRLLVVAAAAAILVIGVTELRDMSVDVLPEFAPPYVEIQTEALGLSAREVENLVTINVEELLTGVPWLQTMRSKSVPGMSSIMMIFKPGTDLMRARQMVQERLTLAYALPNASKPPIMLQPQSATSRVMMVGLSSDELSLIQMSVLARWTIKPRLLAVPGVANVAVWGDRDRQLQVQIDPERLRARGVTQQQVIETAGNALWISPLTFLEASSPGTGGWIDGPNQRLEVRHVLPLSTPEDLARVPVEGTSYRLGDVANVVEGHPPLIGDALLSDGPGLLLVVEKLPGANTLDVTRGVEGALAELQPGLPGMLLDSSVFRSASFIERAFGNLKTVLIVATVLMALVLLVFLYDWRAALISLVAIPLSLAAALMAFDAGTLNTMVLAGLVIALAVVVDDAIISVENIMRRLRETSAGGGAASRIATIRDATLEIRGPMLFATLIALLTIVPVLVLEGVSGAFFGPLAASYALALIASMVVALTVTATLSYFLLRNVPLSGRESPVVAWLRGAYEGVLAGAVRTPRAALVVGALIAAVGIAASPFLGSSLVPSFKERYIRVDWQGAAGMSHPAMLRVMDRASRELQAIPGVSEAHLHVGRAVTGDQIVDVNASQLWIRVAPDADYEATLAAIREAVSGYPGLDHTVESYLTDRVRDALAGASEPIVVRLYGKKRDVLRAMADDVRQAISGIEGITNLRVEGQDEQPHVEVEVDLARAEPYGLKPGDVRRAAATMFAGLGVGFLFEEQKVYDVVVWGTPEKRRSVSDIEDLLVDTPRGGHVRLGDVADVRITPTETAIYHEAVSSRVDVVADVQGRDLASIMEDVETRLDQIEFPLEYYPVILGEYAEREAAQERLLGIAIAIAIGILLLLQAAFKSWRLSVAFLAFLALALAGGVFGVWIDGGVLTLGSLVGFLAIVAIAVRNGVMLMRHYQALEAEGESFGPELVARGTRERFGPVLTTALTLAAALVPMIVFGNAAGLEIVRPMAMVMLGGLVTSTILTLYVVPALYLRFGDRREPDLGLTPAGEGSAA